MDHQHIVAFRQRHNLFEELQFHALRGWVRREAEDHHLRFRITFTNGALQFVEEIDTFHQRH
ncbi:Uncharacterised protein [Shigella sonnei]|nr:Uncharacterised protein [Shigella sonnei]CSF68772.1 Uncharacterised protein [Shigella sonnei]CSF79181.1 Uncharacterised protein [Shigella sonnei]CSF96703.1 Uncharacterised protein [Shigella sonnei]CSG24730.1 Uncharacterised protein [Shigella sonnei]